MTTGPGGLGPGDAASESWQRWEIELDDEALDVAESADVELGEPVPVDSGLSGGGVGGSAEGSSSQGDGDVGDGPVEVVVPWSGRSVRQRPVVPGWLRSGVDRRAAVRYGLTRSWHLMRYHVVRAPLYGARLSARAPVGAGRVVVRVGRWVSDVESRGLQARAAAEGGSADYLQVIAHRRQVVRARRNWLLLGVYFAVVGVAALVVWAPWWAQAVPAVVLVLVLVLVLGLLGRSADRPVVDQAVAVGARARKLSADVVVRAFVAAKLCSQKQPVTFAAPIARDGAGWRAVVDLPYGVTAEQAIKRRTAIASGLDLDEVQVWPDRVRGQSGSARRLALWVADEDPYAKASGPWPWLRVRPARSAASGRAAGHSNEPGGVSIFEAFPFGQDQRGRPIELTLMFTWLLVAAIPRMGKTFAARLAVLAGALDPVVQLHVYDGKGGADWKPFSPIAHRLGLGAREDVVQALLEDLRELRADMDRRYDVLSSLPIHRCPEGKVTPELAGDPRLGLAPVLVVIDEFQRYVAHPVHGEEIVDLLTELSKVGPAAGIMGVLATQKPDKESIPARLRDVIGTRFCLKVMNWQSSDAALGAGAYGAGYDASRFMRAHKGVGWLLGADDSGAVEDAATVRTFLAGPADVDAVVERALAARRAAGTLSGDAIGQTAAAERVDVLADVRAVFVAGEDKLWNERVLERLPQVRDGYYDGWQSAQLTAALKPHGVLVRQVHGHLDEGGVANRRGVHRADLDAALRAQRRAPGRVPAQRAINPATDPSVTAVEGDPGTGTGPSRGPS
ncbi:MAG: hypothetical protein ACRCYU_02695 [Nocardioides sp.]